MAVSCPEVMYGAYYPYLYGRGAARSFHHAPHFQYDRFNVQSGAGGAGGAGAGTGGAAASGGGGGEGYASGAALSSGSTSSGAGSPPHAHAHAHSHAHTHLAHLTHHRLRAKEEDSHGRASADGGGSSESDGECGAGAGGAGPCRARAQYVSANCVVFTHYSGDVATVVDEHFARALALDKHKESVPMASRNLPASFFNAAVAAGVAPGPPCAGVDLYEYDPWHQHYSGYGHAAHRHAAEYHAAAAAQAHHSMAAAAGYGGLLLGRGSLHHQYKPVPVEWSAQHHAPHHLDPAGCSPYSYPPVPAGLEAQVQDTSKDLYWF